jgi:RNA polymerase sigma-70 factor (ECF subfamily)
LANVTRAPDAAPVATDFDGVAQADEPTTADARIRSMVEAHFDFVWRSLRRLGVPLAYVDDAAQDVFLVAARKVARIAPGRERAYLFAVALRSASDARRAQARSRETSDTPLVEEVFDLRDDVELLVEQKRARELLDAVLDALPWELRTVLMLSEGEQLTMAEIAALLDVPQGTVASRLRRAREIFQAEVDKLLDPESRAEGRRR